MKKILLLLLLLSLSACSNDKDEPAEPVVEIDPEYPVVIDDSTIIEKPSSIVSLSPITTNIIIDLGYDNILDGVSDFCNVEKDTVGSTYIIQWDALEDISPDVVVSSNKLSENDIARIEQLGATPVYIPPASDISSLEESYKQMGMIIGGNVTGLEDAINAYSPYIDRLDDVASLIASSGEESSVSNTDASDGVVDPDDTATDTQPDEDLPELPEVTFAYIGQPKLTIATGDTFISSALEYVGFVNIGKDYDSWIFPEEDIAKFIPDLIIYNENITDEVFNTHYATTPAGKNKLIFPINPTIMELQGFDMIDSIIQIASFAYPDLNIDSLPSETEDAPIDDLDTESDNIEPSTDLSPDIKEPLS